MTQRKLSMLPTKYKSLTELISTVSYTIDPERVYRQYQILLPKETTNERLVEIHVWYDPLKDLLKKINLWLSGDTEKGIPDNIELKDILKTFGGQRSYIEYEYLKLDGNVQKAMVHDTPKLNIKQQLAAYTEIKERMKEENPHLNTSLHAENKNSWFSFTSSNGKATRINLWEMRLCEKRQKGFLADYKMSKANKYFQKYVEPNVTSVGWDIYWYDKSDLLY